MPPTNCGTPSVPTVAISTSGLSPSALLSLGVADVEESGFKRLDSSKADDARCM